MGWLQLVKRKFTWTVQRIGPRPPDRARPAIETLESRTTPAATVSLLAVGTLSIIGSANNDQVSVYRDAARNQIVVQDAGAVVARLNAGPVSGILLSGLAGNDVLKIAADVTLPSTILGGAGNDFLQGGGAAMIAGGDGNDKLVAGPGSAAMQGGNGNDILRSSTDLDVLQGDAGADKFFTILGTVLADAGPADSVFGLADTDGAPFDPPTTISAAEVEQLLKRASAATASKDAIIAIVDREGNILGVRIEDGVAPEITGNTVNKVFAIDGAVALARTGAFFANNQAPLTSRTVQFISQTTITQREVDSNPSVDIGDPNSTINGPGFVAPVGIAGHFPPNVPFTPQVDLFAIEHTNRDTTSDDTLTGQRFNAVFNPGKAVPPPDSYGFVSGTEPAARPRGIATLPGGIPLFKNGVVVGGIGVFFPGATGYASEENSSLSTTFNPALADRSLEAEYIGFAAEGGSSFFNIRIGALGGVPPLPGFDLSGGRIDLVGITLDLFGAGGQQGPIFLAQYGATLGNGIVNGTDQIVDTGGDTLLPGKPVPSGWLVGPKVSTVDNISKADVARIIFQGIAQANATRAAIRLPLGSRTRMVFAVADSTGNILGLFRMPDATYFSIDVAVAKARNVAYYANAAKLQAADRLPGVNPGVAFTNRTFRYLALPRFPEGIDGMPPGPFSILNDGGVDPLTGLQVGPPLPVNAFKSVQGFDAFHPGTNFRDPFNKKFQNGIVFFPGSAPLYKNGKLIGGFGVSGDGVDQDDVVTFFGTSGFGVPTSITRADQLIFAGVRLPYQKFNRNPDG